MKILYTSKFVREYKKLPNKIKELAERKETIFKQNPFDPSLKIHRLKGRLKEYWSFSINYRYRIILEFANNDTVYFQTIGHHEIYQ